jgi:hypothetical protein
MLASMPDREAWHAHARVLRWALDDRHAKAIVC